MSRQYLSTDKGSSCLTTAADCHRKVQYRLQATSQLDLISHDRVPDSLLRCHLTVSQPQRTAQSCQVYAGRR